MISLIVISLFFTCSNNEITGKDLKKIPVIYSKNYNIKFLGLQKLHPFDTEKPGKIHKYLIKQLGFSKEQFYNPRIISENKLLEIHTSNYLKSLNNSKTISKILEVEQIKYIPASLLKKIILKPMKFAAGGTLLGTEVALNQGIAINLSGGFHHAKANSGEGF